MLFYSPRYNLYWYVSWSLAKKCILCCIKVQHSRNSDYIMLVDGVEFLYILVDVSINCWERSVDISNYNCTFVYFFFHFYHFRFRYILWSSFFDALHLELLLLAYWLFSPNICLPCLWQFSVFWCLLYLILTQLLRLSFDQCLYHVSFSILFTSTCLYCYILSEFFLDNIYVLM